MKMKNLFLLTIVAALMAILAACGTSAEGSDENKTNRDTGDQADVENLEGRVVIDDSGTVYPLMAKLAEEYMINEQQNVSVEVSRAGTSAGFKKFLAEDGTDFNNASRQIKKEEKATAEELGTEVKELKVALDG